MPARARQCIYARMTPIGYWIVRARAIIKISCATICTRAASTASMGLMLSHGDARHIGGALQVLEEFNPRRVIDNGAPDRSSVHHVLSVRLKKREIATRGKIFALSPAVKARVLYPAAGIQGNAADDAALVMQLIIQEKHRVLFVSDSGLATESVLLAQPNNLRSDILIKGQHHSGQSGSPAFLEAVRPQLIVATSVDFPTRERIPDDWAKMVRERGIRIIPPG